jgi:hypothetical protein
VKKYFYILKKRAASLLPLLLVAVILFLMNIDEVNAQTNPTAQNLTFSQNFGTTTFSTMPTGMAAWTVSSSPKGTQSSAESSTANGDATITTATTIQSTGGCYGYATSSNGRFYIQTSSNTTNGTNQCAAAIITTGLQNIKVSYDVEMISSTARTIGVVLQYRIGTSGSWTTVTNGVYSHNSGDRSNGQVDNFSNLSLPSDANNNSVVQLRWAIWRGSETGNSSGIAIDNISITGSAITYCFRSKQTGNWNSTSTWEMSADSSTWVNATFVPNYHSRTISIQSGHTVTLTASDTVDQLIVNGTFVYGDNSGNTLNVNDGIGTDITVNGIFQDIGPNSINWLSSSTWVMGSSGTLLRTRSTSSTTWRDHYEGGTSNIPSTAYWIIRKTGTDSPTLSSTSAMYYPNLTIENNTGSTWVTGTSSSFSGSSDYPRVKGNLDIGGSGSNTVSFTNENTNATPVLVQGNVTVRSGNTLNNNGTGFEIQGNIIVDGTLSYGSSNARGLTFSGGNAQSFSANGTANIYDLTINKSANNLSLSSSITIDHQLILTSKNIVLGSYNLTIASSASISGGSSSSYVQTSSTGKITKKFSTTGSFTYPTGDGSYYTPYSLTLNSGTINSGAGIDVRTISSAESHVTSYSNYLNRYWEVAVNSITSPNFNVSYVYNDNDIHGSESNFVTTKWDATNGLKKIGTVNTSTNTASATAVTSAGNFTAAGICAASASITHSDADNIFCQGQTDTLKANTSTSYIWSNSATTQSIVVTATGTYTVTITDAVGCTSSASVSTTVNVLPTAEAGNNVSICNGSNTTLNASGGTGYAWSPSTGLSSTSIYNPTANPTTTTKYFVTVTNSSGCSAKDSVIITVNPLPNASAGNNVSICNGHSTTLNASGGTSYAWSPSTGLSSTSIYNPIASPTSTTAYIVTVTNSNGCSATAGVTVTVNSSPNASAGNNVAICNGSNTTLNASGGTSYAWSPSTGLSSTSVYNPTASPTSTTAYTVTVTNSNGCSATAGVTVTVNSLPNASAGNNVSICSGSNTTLSASGGTSYAWSPSTGLSSTSIYNPTASPTSTTAYTVTVTNSGGCSATAGVTITVNSLPTAEAGNDVTITSGGNTTLSASGGTSYAWSPSTGLSSTSIYNPVASPTTTTTYTVTVTDNNSCSATDNVTVTVSSAFTPQNLTYTQNFGTTTFTVMPAGMAAWKVTSPPMSSQSSAESSTPNGDATITAATTTQTAGGCYGYATSSNGRFYVQTSSNATNGTNQCAAAIITTGLQNIKVSYDVEMVSVTARTVGVVLQYRVGTSGSWTTVSGGVYSHNSGDRTAGQVDNFSNLSLPSDANNNSVVQLRWAIWRGTESGSSSGIAIDNILITGTPIIYCFRSKQTGNWNSTSTWEMSADSSTWVNATFIPNYHSRTISIQSGHTVTLTASDTVDQLIVNGTFIYGDNTGSTLTVNNGNGIDITVNGTFQDLGPNSINWLSTSTWVMGSSGTLLRTRSTSSGNWRDHYDSGISNIPSTANWIIRKIGSDSPTLSSTSGMYYPNLTIENNTGSIWIAGSSSAFTGSSDYPRVKGNLDIGGSGTGTVSFLNQNTNSTPVLIQGNVIIHTGDSLKNNGTGFEIQGNITVDGILSYGSSNARELIFSGGNSQGFSGSGFANIYDLTINKSANDLSLGSSITISHQLNLTNRNIILGTYDLIISYTASINGGGSSIYVQTNSTGTLDKIFGSPASFTYTTGDGTYYTPYSLTLNSADIYADNPNISVRVINSAESHVSSYSDYINRYWKVTISNITNPNFDVSYIYVDNDIHGNENNFVTTRWNATTGLKKIGTVNTSTNTASSSSITSAGNFTAAGICAATASITHSDADNIFCQGQTDTLKANISISYLWSNSATTQSIVVTTTGTFTVTITDAVSCTSSASVAVTVNALPNANAGSNVAICSGGNTTFNASGGNSYAWSPSTGLSSTSIYNPVASPTSTITYTVTVTNSSGCSATAGVTVTVNSLPNASAGNNVAICNNENTTLNASGGTGYAWSPSTGLSSTSISNPIASPTQTTTYIVTVIDASGCSATAGVTVTVSSSVSHADAGEDVNICIGNSTMLTASGGTSYHWNTGSNSASITVSPTSNTTYTVTVSNATSCSASDNVTVRVYSTFPTAAIVGNTTVCFGNSATLTASGGGFYHWNTGSDSIRVIVYPISNTVYTVTVTNGMGCAATSTATVTVNQLPKRYSLSSTGLNCSDGSAILITLDGSEIGVNYRLLRNGTIPIGSAQAGTGGILYFGAQLPGIYTIKATNATTTCNDIMIGSVVK